jgi:hypothetical protein
MQKQRKGNGYQVDSQISGKNVVVPGAGWRKSSELNKWNMERHEQDLQLLPNSARRRQKSCAQHVGASHNPRPGLRKIGQPGVYHLVNNYCSISKKQVLLLCMAPRKHSPLVNAPKKQTSSSGHRQKLTYRPTLSTDCTRITKANEEAQWLASLSCRVGWVNLKLHNMLWQLVRVAMH